MAKDAEATLLLNIKAQGQAVIDDLNASLGKMAESAVALGLKMAAAFTAISAGIVAMALDASKFDDIKKAFTSLTESQGVDAKKIMETMIAASNGTMTQIELMKQANQALLLGLPVEKFGDMLKIAQSSAAATGQSMDYMLNSIVVGLGRGSKLMLDNLGILVDVDKANANYAETLGKTSEALTDAEKKQAFINAALETGMHNADNAAVSTESMTVKWAQAKVAFQEGAVALGKELIPAATKLIDVMLNVLDTFKFLAASGYLADWSTAVQKVFLEFSNGFEGIMSNARGLGKLLQGDFKGAGEEADNFAAKQKKLVDDVMALNEETIKRKTKLAIENGENVSAHDRALVADDIAKEEADQTAHEQRMAEGKIAMAKHAEEEAAKEKKKIRLEADEKIAKLMEKLEDEKLSEARKKQKQYLDDGQKEFLRNEKEKNDAAEKLQKDHEDWLKKVGQATTDFISGGLKGLTGSLASSFTETLLPGFGGAAGAAFQLLSQNGEDFKNTMQSFFSAEFLTNIVKNIPVFFQTLVKQLPSIVNGLVKALIIGAPDIAIALATAFTDPHFYDSLVKGIYFGFKDGIIGALSEMGDAIKDAIRGAIGKKAAKVLGFNSGGVVQAYNSGGIIRRMASGGTVDSQMIMARPGEAVIPAQTVQDNPKAVGALLSGRSPGGGGTVINVNVNGGLLGNDADARRFAVKIDSELLKLRRDNKSLAFDSAVF